MVAMGNIHVCLKYVKICIRNVRDIRKCHRRRKVILTCLLYTHFEVVMFLIVLSLTDTTFQLFWTVLCKRVVASHN